ncbi:MAG TPA: phosphohistidine phosphatase SixA [Thermomicrobiales bacterium]|nr:phosphohistidine phosphatase SixA [Thermomicrobiales bacterium]
MRLYLVRHGDAIHDASAGYRSDAERWLTDLGREEVGWTARLLAQLDVRPGLILSSPLVRARQTAEIIGEAFDPPPPLEFSDNLVHGGSFAGILHDIEQLGNPAEVVLTGHMPSIGELVGWLCWNDRASAVRMRTAGVARIDLPDDRIAPGWGDLRWLIPPRAARRLVGA